MNTEKRTERNFASAVSERTCPPSSPITRFFEANKEPISLPATSTKFPKIKYSIPNCIEHYQEIHKEEPHQ